MTSTIRVISGFLIVYPIKDKASKAALWILGWVSEIEFDKTGTI